VHIVRPDRIVLDPSDPRPGYRLRIAPLPAYLPIEDLADICAPELAGIREPRLRDRAWPREREYAEFERIRTNAAPGTVIAGVSALSIVAEARRHYAELGYYRVDINRIELPPDAPYRLAVRAEHLLYSLKDARTFAGGSELLPSLREAGESLALARAVNFGVVSFVVLPPDDALAADIVRDLLAREIVPVISLADTLVRIPMSDEEAWIEVLS
jgi:hypothetical protein